MMKNPELDPNRGDGVDDPALRPSGLDEFIGQPDLRANLNVKEIRYTNILAIR